LDSAARDGRTTRPTLTIPLLVLPQKLHWTCTMSTDWFPANISLTFRHTCLQFSDAERSPDVIRPVSEW